MGERIEFASNGGTATGYLATPPSGNGIPLVVIGSQRRRAYDEALRSRQQRLGRRWSPSLGRTPGGG